MPECIHGLEIPLCDICYPKAPTEKPRTQRVSVARVPRAAAVRTSKKSIDVSGQRVMHVTHIRNLEAILDRGAIESSAVPVVDLSTELTRELRGTAQLPDGSAVSGHVAFYLSPSAEVWDDLRRGAQDETRWSSAARATAAADLVALVSTIGALGENVVVTDDDAAGSLTRFGSGDQVRWMLERLHDTDAADRAEVLADSSVPFRAVQLIGVANDRVRDRVRELTATKVAVYPPWFQQPE